MSRVLQFCPFGAARQITLRRHVTYAKCGGDFSQAHPLLMKTDHTGDLNHVGGQAGNRFSRNNILAAL